MEKIDAKEIVVESLYTINHLDLIKNSNNSLFSHSHKFINVISKLLKQEFVCFSLYSKDVLLGFLPSFVNNNKTYGKVINSLPYYGMHGGVVTSEKLSRENNKFVKKSLLEEFKKYCINNDVISSSIITSPFERDNEIYHEALSPNYVEKRRAQIIKLPKYEDDIKNIIFNKIESRCKRAILKGIRNNVKIVDSFDSQYFEELYNMHAQRMIAIGGQPKSQGFFKLVLTEMIENQDYTFKLAFKDNKIIGGLLLFYHKEYVEYFTPIFDNDYSKYQPNSMLIYESLKDAIKKGYSKWNFGGTGWSMESLYLYKRSWGAREYKYYNYINTFNNVKNIINLSKEEIIEMYRDFYVIPFDILQTTPTDIN